MCYVYNEIENTWFPWGIKSEIGNQCVLGVWCALCVCAHAIFLKFVCILFRRSVTRCCLIIGPDVWIKFSLFCSEYQSHCCLMFGAKFFCFFVPKISHKVAWCLEPSFFCFLFQRSVTHCCLMFGSSFLFFVPNISHKVAWYLETSFVLFSVPKISQVFMLPDNWIKFFLFCSEDQSRCFLMFGSSLCVFFLMCETSFSHLSKDQSKAYAICQMFGAKFVCILFRKSVTRLTLCAWCLE
jgi:hypothetical protein